MTDLLPGRDGGISFGPTDVARSLGVDDSTVETAAPGALPFVLHAALTRSAPFESGDFTMSSFEAAGHTFYQVDRVASVAVWDRVALDGHVLADPHPGRRDFFERALIELADEPTVLAFVRRFVTTFVPVVGTSGAERQLTSCTLPDFPLAVFISDHAQRHIPPVSVARQPSPLLLAENIYHEAVHQYVNFRLLSEDLFPVTYDSRDAPRVEIPWRSSPDGPTASWQLDRVLHAATVYVQLIGWRSRRLGSTQLEVADRAVLEEAAVAAIECYRHLTTALREHVDAFTPQGALFVGRLTRASEEECARALRAVDGTSVGRLVR